jgi:hypothetical protein
LAEQNVNYVAFRKNRFDLWLEISEIGLIFDECENEDAAEWIFHVFVWEMREISTITKMMKISSFFIFHCQFFEPLKQQYLKILQINFLDKFPHR